MAIYYHGLPLGSAQIAVNDGTLLSPEEQWKRDLNWNILSPEEKARMIEQMDRALSELAHRPIKTEENFLRALSGFPNHEYESRFQNLTFTRDLDDAFRYSIRHKGPGVVLGLKFEDNGKTLVRTPVKSLDDLKQVFLNPESKRLQDTVVELFRRYEGVRFYQLQ